MSQSLLKSSPSKSSRQSYAIEPLEARLLLWATMMPTVSALENGGMSVQMADVASLLEHNLDDQISPQSEAFGDLPLTALDDVSNQHERVMSDEVAATDDTKPGDGEEAPTPGATEVVNDQSSVTPGENGVQVTATDDPGCWAMSKPNSAV